MKANLVCKGGGVKGIGIVGALRCLEENGYEWDNLAGTSAGAIITSLLAVGYTSSEITSILYDLDYTSFKDKSLLTSIPVVGDLISILFNKGIYSGNSIEQLIHEMFKAKGKTKFKHISTNGISKLKIIASDVTRKKLLILPDDLVDYDIDPMEFDIAKAVRMSISLPIFYYPVKINYNKYIYYIVDGGLLSNFPIWVFDNDLTTPTFGLNLTDTSNDNSYTSTNTFNYLIDIAQTSLNTSEDIYFREKDWLRIVNIPTSNISATSFDITREELSNLYNHGYNCSKSFLKTWNYDNYFNRFIRK